MIENDYQAEISEIAREIKSGPVHGRSELIESIILKHPFLSNPKSVIQVLKFAMVKNYDELFLEFARHSMAADIIREIHNESN